jgi:DNA replication protein DnaC
VSAAGEPGPKVVRLEAAASAADGARQVPVCPIGVCDGSGWIVDSDDVASECECRGPRLARRQARGLSTAIPARYRGVSFERPPVSDMAADAGRRPVLDAVRQYVDELGERIAEGRGLWLMGDVGTGKTTLAMLISKSAADAGHSIAVYSLPKLLSRIRGTYGAETVAGSYLSFFERLTSVDLLHVDDLGAESRTEWVLEQLYAIVNERYEARRAMIVTTNLSQDALEEQIGARTVSRLVEICGDPLPLFGDDLRYRVG